MEEDISKTETLLPKLKAAALDPPREVTITFTEQRNDLRRLIENSNLEVGDTSKIGLKIGFSMLHKPPDDGDELGGLVPSGPLPGPSPGDGSPEASEFSSPSSLNEPELNLSGSQSSNRVAGKKPPSNYRQPPLRARASVPKLKKPKRRKPLGFTSPMIRIKGRK